MFDKTYTVRGRHAQYWKSLCKTTSDKLGPNDNGQFKVFERYIDAYMVAPLIGCLYNRKGNEELEGSDDTAAMQANILIKYQPQLTMIYRTVLLTDSASQLSDEERIDRAFRSDTVAEVTKENMKIFHDFFLGGLEILYETFVAECTTNDDYVDKIYQYVTGFNKEMDEDELETEIL